MNLPTDWYVEHSGERLILDQEKVKSKIEQLQTLLREAINSRAPDYADVAYPGWSERVRGAV